MKPLKTLKGSRRQKEKVRLQAVKGHYKKIILELQTKLEEVCQRNNESLEPNKFNETISFSEDDSFGSYQ